MEKTKETKKIEMTRNEVVEFHDRLNETVGLAGIPIIYAISRTLAKLKSVIKFWDIEKFAPLSEDFKKYNEEAQTIHMKYSKGKTKYVGKTLMHDFPWSSDADKNNLMEKWSKEMKDCDEKYKAAIDQRKEEMLKYDEFMKETFEEDVYDYIHKISEDKLEQCSVPESMKDILYMFVQE